MTFDDIVRGILSSALTVMFPAGTIFMAYHYARELWVFFVHPKDYGGMKKLKITYGEFSDVPVSTRDRLLVSYPLFIALGGLFSFMVLRHLWDGDPPRI
jgi:hypothetical protein